MEEEIEIFKEKKFWYYSKQRQTGIMVSMSQKEKEAPKISICDNCQKIELALQDVPVLIEMLKRLLHL